MALVYVHGIGNRLDGGYVEAQELRDGLFRGHLVSTAFPERPDTRILSPYWGAHGGALHWGLASADLDGIERLGGSDDLAESIAAGGEGSAEARLLSIARTSLPDAVDALYTVAEDTGGTEDAIGFAAAVLDYTALRESLYPDSPETERYPWLAEVHDDLALVDRLVAEVGPPADDEVETLGGLSTVREWLASGANRLRRAAVTAVTVPPVHLFRRHLGPSIARTFGDVLAHLAHRGTPDRPGPIVQVVADAVERAAADGGPVIVVAHSMGGNIVYDLLSHFRPDLTVDVLVTVGSQVGLFEELKLFAASTPASPVVPDNIRSWINVVDRADPLAFRVAPIFDRATDYLYPSGAVWAHAAYLRQPHFHRRIAHRVAEALA
ncbi:hypothetical protein V5P93_002960 [Actinokineospora auranticolor]|uniref:Alpha/beta hydrolase family protein n=1 Tax=Actinokineospora auranticolor TaxID=155976 RepID=A0A2S6H0V0_9PSEU|nr:hypothetical protein [Actinokineospora auranticolor]PPK71099.1 hypothetical protein CLV40_101285 [Actinokineospora auranticolor]